MNTNLFKKGETNKYNKFLKCEFMRIGNFLFGVIIYPVHKYNLYFCFLFNNKSKGIYLF